MKKLFGGVVILAALSVVFGCVSVLTAQRLGGYKEIARDDPEAESAAEFAVKEQGRKQEMTYKLIAVEHAESQTVAGINYRLCLKVGYHKEDDDVDTTEFVRTVVYKNLQREYSLTSWAAENCGDDSGAVQNRLR
jgi:hypothetical protein